MKTDIHPKWNHQAVVTCACGNTFTTGSTQDTLTVDICAKCHPFFTGEMRFVDRQGRVDKFIQKMKAAEVKQQEISQLQKDKPAKVKKQEGPFHSYKQLLQEQKTVIKAEEKPAA